MAGVFTLAATTVWATVLTTGFSGSARTLTAEEAAEELELAEELTAALAPPAEEAAEAALLPDWLAGTTTATTVEALEELEAELDELALPSAEALAAELPLPAEALSPPAEELAVELELELLELEEAPLLAKTTVLVSNQPEATKVAKTTVIIA